MVAELFIGRMETLILHVIRRNNIKKKILYLKIKYVIILEKVALKGVIGPISNLC